MTGPENRAGSSFALSPRTNNQLIKAGPASLYHATGEHENAEIGFFIGTYYERSFRMQVRYARTNGSVKQDRAAWLFRFSNSAVGALRCHPGPVAASLSRAIPVPFTPN